MPLRPHDERFDVVWLNLTVTQDRIAQCVREAAETSAICGRDAAARHVGRHLRQAGRRRMSRSRSALVPIAIHPVRPTPLGN
jgi:hypothetical protein